MKSKALPNTLTISVNNMSQVLVNLMVCYPYENIQKYKCSKKVSSESLSMPSYDKSIYTNQGLLKKRWKKITLTERLNLTSPFRYHLGGCLILGTLYKPPLMCVCVFNNLNLL